MYILYIFDRYNMIKHLNNAMNESNIQSILVYDILRYICLLCEDKEHVALFNVSKYFRFIIIDLSQNRELSKTNQLLTTAAMLNCKLFITTARQYEYTWPENTISRIVKSGDLEMIKWLRGQGCPLSREMMVEAVKHQQMHILEYGQKNNCPKPFSVDMAISTGNLQMIQWLWNNGFGFSQRSCYIAAYSGDLKVVQQLQGLVFPIDDEYVNGATSGGHIHILEWLITIGLSPNINCPTQAAINGHLETLKWLYNKGYPPIAPLCCLVDKHPDRFEILKWIHEKKTCEITTLTCRNAVRYNRFDILQWAYEHGYPFDETIFIIAAEYASFEIIQWLHERGCLWNEYTMECFIKYRDIKIVRWAYKHGCPIDPQTIFDIRSITDNPKIIRWAEEKIRLI